MAAALAMVGLIACSSSPAVGPVEGFSESDLAGRFVLTTRAVKRDGFRVVADTVELGADRSARRYFYVRDEAGVVTPHMYGGDYQISGDSIQVSYRTTSSGGYGLIDYVTMAVLGTSSRVTRLEANEVDGTMRYDRVGSR